MNLYIRTLDMEEIWVDLNYKDIKDIYEVSSHGRIRNKDNGKLLTGHIDEHGYIQLMLKCNTDKIKKFRMHSLIANTFIQYQKTYENNAVNHDDCNKLNNNIYNLDWVSTVYNNEHARDNGLIHRGEQCHNSNFSDTVVKSICELMESDYSYDHILDFLNLEKNKANKVAIGRIKRRLSYYHISKNYTWEISNKLQNRIDVFINGIIDGYGFEEICYDFKIKNNSSNYDLYRNIKYYGVCKGSTTIENQEY